MALAGACLLCAQPVAGVEDFVGQILTGSSPAVPPGEDPHAESLAKLSRILRNVTKAEEAHRLPVQLIHDKFVPGLRAPVTLQSGYLLVEVQHGCEGILGQGS